jgi:hypothetical protein
LWDDPFDLAIDHVKALQKTKSTTQKYIDQIEDSFSNPIDITVDMFVKREVENGPVLPRNIMPKSDVTRNLSGFLYHLIAEQVYQSEHMIKGMNESDKNQMIIERMKDYPIIFCTDFSKYDASQRQVHLYVEELLCKKICPD